MVDLARGEYRLGLPFDLTAPQVARGWLAGIVAGLPAETCNDVLLLASEIVTNGVRHGRGPLLLTVEVTDGVRVMVHDRGPDLPPAHPSSPPVSVAGGRGLLIVSAVSAAWGVDLDSTPPGKTVWFRVEVRSPVAR